LGGYWKLPKADMNSSSFRDSVISAAKTGTLPVKNEDLEQIYCALGQSVQRLFGVEPTIEKLRTWYADQHIVSSYLIARLASSYKNQNRCLITMEQAKLEVNKIEEEPMKLCARSYVARAQGVCAYQATSRDQLPQVRKQLHRSLECYPFNATTLYLLGMMNLEEAEMDVARAVDLMARSLLLDPDFKGPYVNLGAAFLRLERYEEAIKISEAGLDRHPQSPQCHYHIGIACYRLSVQAEQAPPITEVKSFHEGMRLRALKSLEEARASDEALKAQERGRTAAPWSSEDDQVVSELHKHPNVFLKPRRGHPVDYGLLAGWRWFQWRV